MTYEYWQSSTNNNWYWRFKADNGEKIAQSEGYTTKEKCLRAISLLKGSKDAAVLEKK